MTDLIVASANKGKLAEIKKLLGNRFNVLPMSDIGVDLVIDETGKTFEANAEIKARAIFEITNKPVLSDDSGLMVDALLGEPGVDSAIYAGNHGDDNANNEKLLNNLKNIKNRSAKFVSVICYIDKNGKAHFVRGETHGEILLEGRGNGGFGYDKLFYSPEIKKSFGEADLEEKNSISHRGRALRELIKLMINDEFIY
jgi:XTP/dITP diphosphohydrolase